ncbi:hypothetical protein, partial [Lysinibacillus sphaericus]|uniref:hypothetical protein n=1 Tax=Lysinibacillus sphaericus TaxID=1421 RepID=UPI00056D08D1
EPLNGAVAEEAARRSPTGKQVACNGNPFSPFTKTLWMVLFFNTMKASQICSVMPFVFNEC